MASNYYSREHQGSASEQARSMASSVKDKASDAAAAVQEGAEQAYERVKDTVEERPVLIGMLAAAAVGFAIGALWRQRALQSDSTFAMMRGYAEPGLRALRNSQPFRNSWWS